MILSEERKEFLQDWVETIVVAARVINRDVGEEKLHAYTIYGDGDEGVHIDCSTLMLIHENFNTGLTVTNRGNEEDEKYPYEVMTYVAGVKFYAILSEQEREKYGFKAE